MFLFVSFLVYSSFTFDIVIIGDEFMYILSNHVADSSLHGRVR